MVGFMTLLPVRGLREADAPVVQAWLRTYLAEHLSWWQAAYGSLPASDLAELVGRDWQELIGADPDRQWVRVAGEHRAQGIVFAEKRRDRYMGFEVGVLSWIYVDETARGQGVSTALMTAAGDWMTAQGVRGREVFVTAQNTAAVRLYERHGYRVVDHRMLGP